MFPGYRTEIVGGQPRAESGQAAPRQDDQAAVERAGAPGPGGVGRLSDVAVPMDDSNEFCPDLAVIPAAEVAKNLSAYSPELIEIAIEVVSPSSVRNDYEVKDRAYARRGIPHYLIFDPYRRHCVTLWNPGPDGYLGRDTIPYGKQVTVASGIGTLSVDTAALPVDPSAV
ncbi:Uma2 family endonuclease [Streptomyces sp. NBC_00467]|uniref:Uma2 family endonuclease n=1 Tax=Streptomyces sp. NBC_00467 TaxID=2975752 RepID=UPI002E16D627